MSLDQSQEQDCTVYIQELKSDNPSLKLNAASKISVIGAVLGHNRIKEELIPYLIEIIEQMDNDNEFLVKVCDGILQLKQFCKSPLELSALIYPLRVLASLDQPPVREQATNCLKKLVTGQMRDFYEKYYYPLIRDLASKENVYSPRITACCLIPATYPHLSEPIQAQFRTVFKQFGLKDNSPLVRRAVAENIQQFAGVVDKKTIKGDFYDIWQSLIVDTFDIIRIKALECAKVIARAFKKEDTTEKMFKLIKFVDSNKKSWRVRYSLAQNLPSVLNYLEKDIVKKDVVEIFEELLKDAEAEVRAIALLKLPELTSKLSEAQSFNVFFQYIQKGSKDGNKDVSPTVKLALVEAIVPYLKCIDREKVVESGIPIMAAMLKDENQLIRIGIMQKVMQLNDLVGKENTIKYLVPLIEGCLNDKKWRFKFTIAQNIPRFFKALPYNEHKEFLDKIVTSFLKDHNYTVREQTLKSLFELKIILDYDTYSEMIEKHYKQLVSDGNYIYRVTSSFLLQYCKNLEKPELSNLFSHGCKTLQQQKVANVLVSYLAAYLKVKQGLLPATRKEVQAFVNRLREEKQDEDVLFYVSKVEE